MEFILTVCFMCCNNHCDIPVKTKFVSSLYQAQASDQFLATNKLATNKAICLKIKKRNKSKMYF